MPLDLRVVTWNVHKCTGGLDRRCDPARVADRDRRLVFIRHVHDIFIAAAFDGRANTDLAAIGTAQCAGVARLSAAGGIEDGVLQFNLKTPVLSRLAAANERLM